MPTLTPVTRFAAGDPSPGAARLNEIVDALNVALMTLAGRGASTKIGTNVRVVALKIKAPIKDNDGYYDINIFEGVFSGKLDGNPLTEEQLGDPIPEDPDAVGINLLQIDGGAVAESGKCYLGMVYDRLDDGGDRDGKLLIAFAPGGGLPRPQLQGMVLISSVDRKWTANFNQTHSITVYSTGPSP